MKPRVKNYFQILLSLSITAFSILSFALLSWFFQQNLYQVLVEQAVADNRVIGESVLALLKQVHAGEEQMEHILPSVQNSCNILKLPNGGFICAAMSDGALVAAPNMKPEEIGKGNLNNIQFVSLKREKVQRFNDLNQDSAFSGYFEHSETKHSHVIVKLKHKSGLHILVHQDNNKIMAQAQEQSNKLFMWGILSSLLIGLVIYIFVNFQINLYQNTIEKQNQKIVEAHQSIEEQHKNIIASITYAQRIQQSILPTAQEITNHLPEHFILFKPRDIVSGDFYYVQPSAGKLIVAVADCTGHGVPGALMTMLGNEILNEVIQNKHITAPDQILNELHKNIRERLKQKDTANRDGMDITLVTIDQDAKSLAYAGAKNSLLYVQAGELHTLKADKTPIGGEQTEQERVFSAQTVALQGLPTTFYMVSDGFQDQFGSKEKKKFGSNRFKQLLQQVQGETMSTQSEILDKTLQDWIAEGKEKQIDDILVMGFRLNF